jgi:hypothetical protein
MTDGMLFDDLYREPTVAQAEQERRASEAVRQQREAVVDAVWKWPGLGSFKIAELVGISERDAWRRLCEAGIDGDVYVKPGWGDSGGWWPGRAEG